MIIFYLLISRLINLLGILFLFILILDMSFAKFWSLTKKPPKYHL
jgi:hypothetical protein